MNSRNQFKFHKDAFLEYRFLGFSRSEELPANSPQSVCCRPYQARYAIFLCLRELGFSNEDEVLAPSYICAAAVEPIRAYGCKPVFYPVTAECSSNLAEIENRIGPRTRALLVVHYFGFANRCLRQLRDLCDRRNLVLIEDCAHVLSGEVQGVRLGQMGDVAVFSFRKFLPVPDGAGLQFNRREASRRRFNASPLPRRSSTGGIWPSRDGPDCSRSAALYPALRNLCAGRRWRATAHQDRSTLSSPMAKPS